MSDTMQMIAAAMRADAETVRVIGQNIANADTVAYRRQVAVVTEDFEKLLTQAGEAVPQTAATRLDVLHDFKPGTLKSTSEPLHLALEGSGFFLLQSAGAPVLTRRGDFRIDAEGTLIAANGLPVLGVNGPIHLSTNDPTIDPDGSVREGADVVDQLRVVHVADNSRLTPVGDGTFAVDPGFLVEGDVAGIVRQGFLETSNVAPVSELVQLMETVRHFEAEQRFASAYHDLMGQAISELGRIG